MLLIEGESSRKQLSSIRYLNNCYLVIAQLKPTGDLANSARMLSVDQDWHEAILQSVEPKERTFRLVLSDDSQLVGGDREVAARLCSTIQRLTNLQHAPRGGDVEFWLLRRRSNQVFLCKRLSRRSRTEKILHKGELRPELAHLLCLLSEPQLNDVFLDPFAGSGAIPFARTHYPYDMIFAFDNEEENLHLMRVRIKDGNALRTRKRSPLILGKHDARNLKKLEIGFIDKVVTDPPWGFFDTSLQDLKGFYRSVLDELCRVTKTGGILVLLLGDRDLAEELSHHFHDDIEMLETYGLLVAGKKATVCKWRRK